MLHDLGQKDFNSCLQSVSKLLRLYRRKVPVMNADNVEGLRESDDSNENDEHLVQVHF